MKTASLLLLALSFSVLADEKKPFGTGMNGEKPSVPYQGTVEYWQQAAALYPEAADVNSPLFKEMVKINQWLEQTKDPVCSVPDRKLRVARMAAAKLGMPLKGAAPKGAAPTSSVPVSVPAGAASVNPAELMTMIQQEEAAAGKTRWTNGSPASLVYSSGKWAGKTKEQLIAGCCQMYQEQFGVLPFYEKGAPIGGWKTDADKRAANEREEARTAELSRRADDERHAMDQKRALDEIKRNTKKPL